MADDPKSWLSPQFKHDLLNRVGAAKMSAELIQRQRELPAAILPHLERIISNLSRLRDMVDQTPPKPPALDEALIDEPAVRPITKKSVLLIDDSADLRDLFRAVLTPRGYDFRSAQTLEDVQRELNQSSLPDIVLLDYQLEQMTGPELLDQLESSSPETLEQLQSRSRIVLFSGYGQLVSDRRVHAVVEKSLDLKSLLRLLETT